MNDDFRDFLRELLAGEARFLVVGAHALAVHGIPRATGDLDVWIASDPENAERVLESLRRFGAPLESLDLSVRDLTEPDNVLQIGLPPRRIDVLTSLTGVDFDEAWNARVVRTVDSLEVPFIDRDTLIRNKRATGRSRDQADVERLENEGRGD